MVSVQHTGIVSFILSDRARETLHLAADLWLNWPLTREMRDQKNKLGIRKIMLVGYECLITSVVKS